MTNPNRPNQPIGTPQYLAALTRLAGGRVKCPYCYDSGKPCRWCKPSGRPDTTTEEMK